MYQEELQAKILERLYDLWFLGRDSENLNSLCDEFGIDRITFWNVVEYMHHNGLIKPYAMGGYYIIGTFGILMAEEQNIGSEKIKKENQRIRTAILEKLAKIHEESGSFSFTGIDSMFQELGVDKDALANNLQLLKDLGYVERVGNNSFKISFKGLESVKEWREMVNLAEQYNQISKLKPQPRGRALQKLLAKVIEKDGWLQEESVQTSYEEMDIVIHKAREYFLIECKWEKEEIEAAVVRELFGKLSNRIGVQGIIVSMSGFTSGAVEQAQDYASSRIILLFGKDDVEKIIIHQTTFDELLDEKYQQLITRRKISFA